MPKVKVVALVPVLHRGNQFQPTEEFEVSQDTQEHLDEALESMTSRGLVEVIGDPVAAVKRRRKAAQDAKDAAARADKELEAAEAELKEHEAKKKAKDTKAA